MAIATTLASANACAQQAPAASNPPAYPWDTRPAKCLAALAPLPDFCREPDHWMKYGESVWRVQTLFADRGIDLALLDRAATELAGSRERFDSGEYRFEAWYYAVRTQLMLDERSRPIAERWSSGPRNWGASWRII